VKIALKVDVDTFRGTREGVPALLRLFDRYQVRATFLFSLGPDHTGRALRRIFRPGFLGKVRRTSVTSHYGYRTLMYGVLLPGPHIGRKAGPIMREARDRGHELGIHCYDHVRWQDFVAARGLDWTRAEMDRAHEAFCEAVEQPPATIGAAGWQINRHVLALEQDMGFRYASDVRGATPFLPRLDGVTSACLQIPTTLPTLDELLGSDGHDIGNVDTAVELARKKSPEQDHVYTLHAELEGQQCLPVLERLLQRWLAEGIAPTSLGDIYQGLDLSTVPVREVVWREVPGRSGKLACAGEPLAWSPRPDSAPPSTAGANL